MHLVNHSCLCVQGAELFDTETRLRSALQSAAEDLGGGVSVEVITPPNLDGFLRVQLSCSREAEVGAILNAEPSLSWLLSMSVRTHSDAPA